MMPDPELLREIGINSTNVETAWAGAADDLARGLNFWTRTQIGTDRAIAVRAAFASCKLVVDDYNEKVEGLPPRKYVDDMIELIQAWLDNPSRENTELVRSTLDVTRSAHAWQRDKDLESAWILEAVDHASLAVWSGERSSYIVPMDFGTCAARSVACVLHAMIDAGKPEAKAIESIVTAVRHAVG
jgi:hypothetical protein